MQITNYISYNKIFHKSPWLNTKKKKSSFSPIDLGFLYGLTIPIFCIFIFLKWQRVSIYGRVDGFFDYFYLFYSDICLYIALISLGIGIFGLSRSLIGRSLIFIFLQIFVSIFVILEICAHNYYMTTGFFLNFDLLQYCLQNLQQVSVVLGGSTSWKNYILLIISIFIVLLGPWLVAFLWILVRQHKHIEVENLPLWIRLLCLTVSCIFLTISLIPNLSNQNTLFTQNLVVNISKSFIDSKSKTLVDPKSLWKSPVKSSLVSYANAKHRNFVLVVLESTRADATSLYNSELKTTPYLKKLSKESLLLKNTNALNPHTSKSLVAIHCGIEPRTATEIKEADLRGIPSKCLPTLLSEVGYDTVWFQVATENFENRKGLISNFGYDEFYSSESYSKDGFYPSNYFGYEDKVVLKPVRDWLKNHKEKKGNKPFMLGLLTNISHHYYTLPPNYQMVNFNIDPYKNRYLNTVHYMDNFIKEFMEQYKDLGLYSDTVFLFIGDHGEALNEHGVYGHSHTVYRETMKIPFMIHDPLRFKQGVEINKPVYQPDILPTITYLLDYKVQNNFYRGTNFLIDKTDYILPMNCWNVRDCVAMYNSNYKYIHFFNKKPDEMYDLLNDPNEFNNIIKNISKVDDWKNKALTWYNKIDILYERYQTQTEEIKQ